MTNSQNDEKHWFEKTTDYLEKNLLGVKLGIYGIGLCGLAIAIRSVRPFKKLVSPTDVPSLFIDNHYTLNGKVLSLDYFPKTVLIVDHMPLLGGRFRKPTGLPVSIEGVNISGNGISWLQSIVVGKPVQFTLLYNHPEYVSCIVFQDKRNIGTRLVALGFGSVAPFNSSLESCAEYTEYYKQLLKEEDKAERNGAGIWWEKPRKRFYELVLSKLSVLTSKSVLTRLKLK